MNWQYFFQQMKVFIHHSFSLFWKRNPALWVALSCMLGLTFIFMTKVSLVSFACIFFFLPHKKKYVSLMLFLLAMGFAKYYYVLPEQEKEGKATFTISSLSKAKYGGYYYQGTLHTFKILHPNQPMISSHLPCRIFNETLYHPHYEYIIEGQIKQKAQRPFVTLKSKKPWMKTKKIFSCVQKRMVLKKTVSQFLSRSLKEPKVASFLTALITGEASDDVQKYVFGHLGLAHLFAISGFHFSLFVCAFHFFLQMILPKKAEACVLLLILSLCLLFFGAQVSVMRAWFTAIFALIALIVEKEKRSLNTLGLALLFVILINPYTVNDLSFQLSFLATAGILLFYSSFNHLLQFLFPQAFITDIVHKNVMKQYGHIISQYFRKALSLNFAVHLVLFPIQIAVFSKFPWHSLVYNLFFPFLVSIALFLLLFSVLIAFLCPWIGMSFFYLTTYYTKSLLKIIEFPPFPQKTWYVESTFPGFAPLCLTGIFFLGILWRYYWEQKRSLSQEDFPMI